VSARPSTDVDHHGDTRIIWNGEQQAFNPGILKQAMLVRGFTAETLAQAATVSRGTIYNVLAGRPTRLRTARRVLEALAATEPTLHLASLNAVG
jgi:predicted transcriptional regulator